MHYTMTSGKGAVACQPCALGAVQCGDAVEEPSLNQAKLLVLINLVVYSHIDISTNPPNFIPCR